MSVIAVVGATGTGKSLLAEEIALSIGGEIVSADSMQVYKGMDIGTAKIPANKRRVPYHCLDIAVLDTAFTAALYQRAARASISELLLRGCKPVVCGGTGLYVRAALDDLDFSGDADGASGGDADGASGAEKGGLRARLSEEAAALGPAAFHARLAAVDAESAALIHPNNVRRVIRAFELLEQNMSYARRAGGFVALPAYYPTRYLGIEVSPALLYSVLDKRVDALMAAGLLDEVRSLADAGHAGTSGFSQAIGYKELYGFLAGERTLDDAVAAVKQATRRYAKRQRTWFKRDGRISWIEADDLHEALLNGELEEAGFARELLRRASLILGQEGCGASTDLADAL